MEGFVYLIRNGDLFYIGSTNDLENRMSILNPDEIILTVKNKEYKALEARLLRRYRKKRIPESGYFRLNESEIIDCQEQMGPDSVIPRGFDAEFRIAITASILTLLICFMGIKLFQFSILFSLSIAIGISSFPMMLLSIFGNLGGYYSKDLAPFSTLLNRLKALLMASLILSASFTVYQLFIFTK